MVWDKRPSASEELAALKWKPEKPVGTVGKKMFAAGTAEKAPVGWSGDTYSLCSRWKIGAQLSSQVGSFPLESA